MGEVWLRGGSRCVLGCCEEVGHECPMSITTDRQRFSQRLRKEVCCVIVRGRDRTRITVDVKPSF